MISRVCSLVNDSKLPPYIYIYINIYIYILIYIYLSYNIYYIYLNLHTSRTFWNCCYKPIELRCYTQIGCRTPLPNRDVEQGISGHPIPVKRCVLLQMLIWRCGLVEWYPGVYPKPETNSKFAPENRPNSPPQKETRKYSHPHHFQVLLVC